MSMTTPYLAPPKRDLGLVWGGSQIWLEVKDIVGREEDIGSSSRFPRRLFNWPPKATGGQNSGSAGSKVTWGRAHHGSWIRHGVGGRTPMEHPDPTTQNGLNLGGMELKNDQKMLKPSLSFQKLFLIMVDDLYKKKILLLLGFAIAMLQTKK